jgi:transketolase
VSMPCWELFEAQSESYKLEVFTDGVPVMSVEAAGIQGWQKYAHAPYGMIRFGSSGKGPSVYDKFGFTPEKLTVQAKKVLDYYKKGSAPSLIKRPQLDYVHYNAAGH